LTGINITGVITATSITAPNYGNVNSTALNVSGVSTFQASSFWGDGDVAYFGDGQDLLIFHNSTDSIIRDNGTGDLFIEGGNRIRVTSPTGIETYAVFNQDGAVELWFDNSKELETTGYGATVFGVLQSQGLQSSGIITATNGVQVGSASSITVGNVFIRNNQIGLGATTTAALNAGIGTVTGTIVFNSDSRAVELWNGTRWVTVGGGGFIEASGGDVVDYNEGSIFYRAHIFRGSGTFSVSATPSTSNTVDILMVGGGASGGTAGGGGAGGLSFIKGYQVSATPGSYPISLGGGGAALGPYPSGATGIQGNDGSTTSAFGMSVSGGGGGGAYIGSPGYTPTTQGRNGASGGGGGWHPVQYANSVLGGISTTPGQGYPGGKGGHPGFYATYVSGGGGGAGQAGQSAQVYKSGDGGNGLQFTITGQALFYAGGGGGGSQGNNNTSGNGGLGGGGGGGAWNTSIYGDGGPVGYGVTYGGQPGAPFGTGAPAGQSVTGSNFAADGWGGDAAFSTGSGGGGMGISVIRGGSGGSGIVVVRYPIGGLRTVPKATGGNITYANGKTIHTFTTSGTFTVTNPTLTSVDYLIAAGGGGGGGGFDTNATAGGGGAGGLRTGTGQPVSASPGVYSVVVGSGGRGGVYPGSAQAVGSNGNNSSALGIPATGGGGGNAWSNNSIAASPGGSGGGGANNPSTTSAGTGTPDQGNPGGTAQAYNPASGTGAGGGGGAGAAGSPAPGATTVGGAGGIGLFSSISGQTVMYCAGGGGGGQLGGAGYLGVSGNGGGLNINGTSGSVGTGGGGGGGGTGLNSPTTNPLANTIGGNGGSGIVIISYPS
jgi:hypothetical protein